MEGAAAGVLLGSAILSWYPDPYQYEVKNTVYSRSLGLRYVLAGLQRPVLWASLVCGTYSGVECILEQMRDEAKSSTWVNSAVAGAASGVVMASMTKRFDVMAATALGVGALMGMVEYNGQTTASDKLYTFVQWRGILPTEYKESSTLEELKKKYPEYKE